MDFFFQAEDGIRDGRVTGVQTCALPICRINHRDGTTKRWSPEAIEKLLAHHWPGNVRELKNAVERAAILADAVIGPDLVAISGGRPRTGTTAQGSVLHVPVGSTLEEVERRLILATLAELNGDKRKTAETLGMG